MQKNDDGKIIGLKCKACIEFEKEISDMTMFKIHVFMFFVHYNRLSILCPFKIILGSIEVVPVCLLRAHSLYEPVTVNIANQDRHSSSSFHLAWNTKNTMTHRIISNRKSIPLNHLVGMNHDMVGMNRSCLPKW